MPGRQSTAFCTLTRWTSGPLCTSAEQGPPKATAFISAHTIVLYTVSIRHLFVYLLVSSYFRAQFFTTQTKPFVSCYSWMHHALTATQHTNTHPLYKDNIHNQRHTNPSEHAQLKKLLNVTPTPTTPISTQLHTTHNTEIFYSNQMYYLMGKTLQYSKNARACA